MRILIVDDDETILELLDGLLTAQGYEVSRASSGREALRLIETGRYPMAILDWVMPGIDGLELLQVIRANLRGPHTYTIILSGKTDDRDVVEGLTAGADDYMRKPFCAQELLVRLRHAERVVALGARHVAIFAMAKLAEARDSDTGQHLERIRGYSWILAQRLAGEFDEITDEFLESIYQTSVLHDVGKVGIPDCILLKPDRLTDREIEMMRRHTTIGADALAAAAAEFPDVAFLTMAGDIALTHHENFDGTGYPAGLSGCDIPLAGRIVAVADVYDALTSKRPYKPAFDHEVAKSMLLERQRHFDPYVLEAFLDEEDRLLGVRQTFSDQANRVSLTTDSPILG